MDTGSSIAVKNNKGKRNSLAEVSNVERQLWASILSMGLLNAHVQNLYRKACGLYEQILIGNNELEELQETEYCLWKLHYKHIDEFRKQTSQSPEKEESTISKNPGNVQEGFKLFLEESFRFYQHLISKVNRYYCFGESILFYHTDSVSSSIDYAKLHKCRFVCHRLLVRLGDLARYLEVNQNPGNQQRNWSVVAKCYFKAAKIYPDGGNPHNQLALLATPTYIGDEFLALYHCVRSIAVKEPFPDASDNLVFIFERNRSLQIHSLSVGSQFNFLKPSERVMESAQAQASKGASESNALRTTAGACYLDANFWSLFVRVISFFYLESSLERFSYTFASTIRELEALLALDDAKLSMALESYQNVNISRPGPYRSIQVVVVLIFTVHNLSGTPELQCMKKLQMALTTTFIFMGRVVERCLRGIPTYDLAFLPAVMVFSEWLVEVLTIVEQSEMDEKLTSAASYFFSSFVELLNQLRECKNQVESLNSVALWEDFEMRGFIPVSQCHSSLDFLTYRENETNFRLRNEYRVHRIIQAATKIANRSTDGTQRWILYEKGGKFCTKEARTSMQTNALKVDKQTSDSQPRETKELSNDAVAMVKENEAPVESKSVVVEEEEDIVFTPITRHDSASFSDFVREKEATPEESKKGLEPPASDESLRHASSLLIAQNRALIDSLTSHTGPTETHPKSSMFSTIMEAPRSSAGPGPPSLSTWVLNGERNGNAEEDILKPINKIAPESLSTLSQSQNKRDEKYGFSGSAGEASTSTNCTSSQYNYYGPTPSAPLLPEDATWFTGPKSSSFMSTSPLSFGPSHPPPPPWPYPLQCWSNFQNNGIQQHQYVDPSKCAGTLYTQEGSSWTNHFDQRYPLVGSPAVYIESTLSLHPTTTFANGIYNPRGENAIFHHHMGYGRSNSHVHGPVTAMDSSADPQQLLQYLKEREWINEQEAQFTHSTYPRK